MLLHSKNGIVLSHSKNGCAVALYVKRCRATALQMRLIAAVSANWPGNSRAVYLVHNSRLLAPAFCLLTSCLPPIIPLLAGKYKIEIALDEPKVHENWRVSLPSSLADYNFAIFSRAKIYKIVIA
jgi:hypothetical protein